MVRIAWATDVHLNAADAEAVASFCAHVVSAEAHALLIGGDIAEAPDLIDQLLGVAVRIPVPIYFVLGNHDYYGDAVAAVRERVRGLDHSNLHWLPKVGCVPLTSNTALVGHGGWGDARIGDFARAPIMTDFLAIEDLIRRIDRDDLLDDFQRRGPLQRLLNELGDDAADTLRPALHAAVTGFREVLVLTHVPPFREASWYDGRISSTEWLPHTTCKAVGDLLMEVAGAHREAHLKVLCGHTHGEGHAWIAPNLEALTQGAEYGRPGFRVLDVP